MKIDTRAQGIELSASLHEHIERCLDFRLHWARHEVSRIVISLSDINGPRGGNDKCCQVRIPLSHMRDVLIDEVADDLRVAIARAIDRAARSLERRLSRQREFGPTPLLVTEE